MPGKKARGYYESHRDEIADLIPHHCERILDVGCGYGGLGVLLKKQRNRFVFGIEINASAARHLTQRYDRFFIGSVDDFDIESIRNKFDCMVFADVLEHLIDPWATLDRFMVGLATGGTVIISVPNVRNLAVILKLLIKGRWEYKPSGILDEGHLRFFTKKELVGMIKHVGLYPERILLQKDYYAPWFRLFASAASMIAPELDACQIIVRATKKN